VRFRSATRSLHVSRAARGACSRPRLALVVVGSAGPLLDELFAVSLARAEGHILPPAIGSAFSAPSWCFVGFCLPRMRRLVIFQIAGTEARADRGTFLRKNAPRRQEARPPPPLKSAHAKNRAIPAFCLVSVRIGQRTTFRAPSATERPQQWLRFDPLPDNSKHDFKRSGSGPRRSPLAAIPGKGFTELTTGSKAGARSRAPFEGRPIGCAFYLGLWTGFSGKGTVRHRVS